MSCEVMEEKKKKYYIFILSSLLKYEIIRKWNHE
jgi:hypothetical protein